MVLEVLVGRIVKFFWSRLSSCCSLAVRRRPGASWPGAQRRPSEPPGLQPHRLASSYPPTAQQRGRRHLVVLLLKRRAALYQQYFLFVRSFFFFFPFFSFFFSSPPSDPFRLFVCLFIYFYRITLPRASSSFRLR